MNKPRSAPRRRVDGVLLLDKPGGMTSNAALQKVRWLFNAAKAGHTGTLDPMATGLLPLCFGEATKFAGELLDADKSYRASLRFGVTTDTADSDGRVLERRPVAVAEEQLRAAMATFVGEIDQVPPMYSALKRDGKPLYEYARAGIELERQARQVTVHRLELLSLDGDVAVINVDCSKGTYVRTLAADIGAMLGCGAHLVALRRTRIGSLDLTSAVGLADLEGIVARGDGDHRLAPVDALLTDLQAARLDELASQRIGHGQTIRWLGGAGGSRLRLIAPDGTFFGVADVSADGWLVPRRLLSVAR